jgi:hypothetical protein
MTWQFQVLFDDISYAGCIASVIDVWMRMENWWNNAERKSDVFVRKACPSGILSTTYPACISVGSNSGVRCERPTTVRSMARHGRTKRKTTVCSQFSYPSIFVSVIIMFSIIHLHVLGGVIESAGNFWNEAKDTERLALELPEAERSARTLERHSLFKLKMLFLLQSCPCTRDWRRIGGVEV